MASHHVAEEQKAQQGDISPRSHGTSPKIAATKPQGWILHGFQFLFLYLNCYFFSQQVPRNR